MEGQGLLPMFIREGGAEVQLAEKEKRKKEKRLQMTALEILGRSQNRNRWPFPCPLKEFIRSIHKVLMV